MSTVCRAKKSRGRFFIGNKKRNNRPFSLRLAVISCFLPLERGGGGMKITANDIFTYTLVLIGILDLLISIIRLVIDTKKKYPSIFPKVGSYFLIVHEGGNRLSPDALRLLLYYKTHKMSTVCRAKKAAANFFSADLTYDIKSAEDLP